MRTNIHKGLACIVALIWLILVIQTRVETLIRLLPLMLFLIQFRHVNRKSSAVSILIAEPMLFMIGIGYLWLHRAPLTYLGLTLPLGVWEMISILLRGTLAIVGITGFVNWIGMEGLSSGLNALHVPQTFILILMQTYRYIGLLTQKVRQMHTAYSLRSRGQRGIQLSAWGSFPGQLLLLSLKQAEATHDAMRLRGFNAHNQYVQRQALTFYDLRYALFWGVLFTLIITML